jgi:hypothetical protein
MFHVGDGGNVGRIRRSDNLRFLLEPPQSIRIRGRMRQAESLWPLLGLGVYLALCPLPLYDNT